MQPWVRTDSSAAGNTKSAAAVAPSIEPAAEAVVVGGVANGLLLCGSCIAAPAGREAEALGCDRPPGPVGRPVSATAVSSNPCAPSKPSRRMAEAIIMFRQKTSNCFSEITFVWSMMQYAVAIGGQSAVSLSLSLSLVSTKG